MQIRRSQPSDTETLVAVFRDAVLGIGSRAYTDEQIAIWSSYPDNLEEFRDQLSQGLTLVALQDSQVVAFGQLNPLDRIAYLYTRSDFERRGCATQIYHELEDYAIEKGVQCLHTEASRISKHFFLKMGFRLLEREMVARKGVQFERFKMKKKVRVNSEQGTG